MKFIFRSIEWNLIQPKEIRSKFNVDQIKKQRDSQFDQYDRTNSIDRESTRSLDQVNSSFSSSFSFIFVSLLDLVEKYVEIIDS